MDRYQYTGISLASFGIPLALYSYFILLNIPLTALGLSCIILGATLLLVPPSPLPFTQLRAMLDASLVNIEALLEEYDVLGKAIYHIREGRVNAVIPVSEKEINIDIENIPLRVLTHIDGEPFILVFPPGSELVRLAMLPDYIGVEDALTTILVDTSELVDSVKAVVDLNQILVELENPRATSDYMRVNHSLGSLPVSVAGCVISSVMGKAVALRREENADKVTTAVFEVLEYGS